MMPVCSNIRKQSVYVQEPRYPDLVNLQTRFESVMESTGYGINLALDMKSSEMAVRDLNTLVGGIKHCRIHYSHRTRSGQALRFGVQRPARFVIG
jgi:hypothetical protein